MIGRNNERRVTSRYNNTLIAHLPTNNSNHSKWISVGLTEGRLKAFPKQRILCGRGKIFDPWSRKLSQEICLLSIGQLLLQDLMLHAISRRLSRQDSMSNRDFKLNGWKWSSPALFCFSTLSERRTGWWTMAYDTIIQVWATSALGENYTE